jgi:hypothetical protein
MLSMLILMLYINIIGMLFMLIVMLTPIIVQIWMLKMSRQSTTSSA